MYSRLSSEVFLCLATAQVHPWQAVVIYPTRAVDAGAHPHYDVLLQSAQVTRVYLDEWAQSRQTLMQRVIGVLLTPPAAGDGRSPDSAGALRTSRRRWTRSRPVAIVNIVENHSRYKLRR